LCIRGSAELGRFLWDLQYQRDKAELIGRPEQIILYIRKEDLREPGGSSFLTCSVGGGGGGQGWHEVSDTDTSNYNKN